MASRTPTAANSRPKSVVDNESPSRPPPRSLQTAGVRPDALSSSRSSASARLTRSSARHAASQVASPEDPSSGAAPSGIPPVPQDPSTNSRPSRTARKRKAQQQEASSSQPSPPNEQQKSSSRRSKRQKVHGPPAPETQQTQSSTPARKRKGKAPATMSNPDDSTVGSAMQDNTTQASASASSSRKSSRNKRSGQMLSDPTNASSSTRRPKRTSSNHPQPADPDTTMTGTDEHEKEAHPPPRPPPLAHDPDSDSEEHDEDEDEDDDPHRHYDDDDPFGSFGGPPGSGLTNTLRALTGMMSGMPSRLRDILNHLRMKEEPSIQMVALQELSELLLVSNEDNLAGHFSPDAFVKELVALMQPSEIMGENPDMMLLACRCLANLMEALPASTANVVYGGAVPILCQKLLEIQFIDLAEQALSTLEKISVDYPASIVREGGLTACLSYLDFFATSTQRTAVTTAANCCRNIPEDSFPVIKDVMPILLNVLRSNDQRVVEQASLCVTRIIESFKYQAGRLEELVSVDLLRAILRLLVPGTTNLIGANIHTQFLRVLALTARASPRLSAELFKLNVVETLYQILTGVSPPAETEDVASKLDSVVIMQALIHRPREQIIETLNVVCELLPGHKWNDVLGLQIPGALDVPEPMTPSSLGSRRKSSYEKRLELLEDCKDQVRRFALILFPTLTDAFSSTVNLSVRQKVLIAQLKMLSNFDKDVLVDALKSVPYASFLAAILSQQDHPSLVMSALQITELLLNRLDDIYRYQIYREGVVTAISKLAEDQPLAGEQTHTSIAQPSVPEPSIDSGDDDADDGESDRVSIHNDSDEDDEVVEPDPDEDEADHDDDGENEDDDIENDHHDDDLSGSPASSDGSTMSLDGPPRLFIADIPSLKTRISEAARKFLETHETEKQSKTMKKKATKILNDLQDLASEIEAFYIRRTANDSRPEHGIALFEKLSSYFEADVLESVTSAELLASGLVRVLEAVFSNPDEALASDARASFLEVFMDRSIKSRPKTAVADSPATSLSVLVHKLQDLLSRSEHFEVLTVHQNAFDGNRSSAASMLAKQIRLKLVADHDSDIPSSYRNIMVSIHAIATFKALDDYLRPRIILHDRARGSRPRDGLSRALAAMAGIPPERLADRLGFSSSPVPPPPVPTQASSSRPARKSKSRSAGQADTPSTPNQSGREKVSLRRSTRRHPPPPSEPQPPPPAPDGDEDMQNALECADEKQISETDDADVPETTGLDAIVGDLDEDMDDSPAPDPSAVNLEVAAGGKITARKEDGTRVPTPSQSAHANLPTRSAAHTPSALSQQNTPTPPASSRPLSYAAAVQAVPQDWHIEFSLDNRVIPNETTIYRAVHKASSLSDDHLSRSVWSAIHPIKIRRVPGPPPAESIGFASFLEGSVDARGNPASLANHPTTASILRLLKILHDLNANLDDILVENKYTLRLNIEPLSQFVNTKLTAKLNRQLEEPLIVASNCLPGWSEDLARLYPFLFPFETRHLFLQSTSFGYARSMTRWQNAQEDSSRRDRRDDRPFLGRLQRQKVRISRTKILESALKVMELYGSSQSILEVEYFDEVGTGLGPTLEFYSTVSKEFSKKKLKLWREMESNDSEEFVSGPHGLFPRPLGEDDASSLNTHRILHMFTMLGKFVARSMIDSRIIDFNFNPIFFRFNEDNTGVKPSLGAVKVVDPVLANSLKHIKTFALARRKIDEDPYRTPAQKVADIERITFDHTKIDDLALDFTLPGYPDLELVPGGSHMQVTIYNVDSYLERVIDMTLGSGVKRQIEAFRSGFSQVFPYSALSAFTPDELVSLFGRVEEDWSLETLMDSIKADHGYNMDSKSVKNLLQTMSELTQTQRRDFLQFTTGSPKLPIGGFKALTPMFTVVCKPSEPPYTSDDYLPSVMTCVNYLKLPDYTSIESMKKQLFVAIKEGQGAFHLS